MQSSKRTSARMARPIAAAVGVALACAFGGAAAALPAKKPKPTTTTAKKSTKVKVVDPCVLVTKTQAETLIAMTLLDGTKSGNPVSGQMCQYNADPNGPVGSVQVSIGPGVKKALDIDKDNLKHDFTKLTGTGDEAWLENGSVFVRKGTQWAQVYVVALDTPPEQIQSGLQTLAGTIAKSL